MLLFLKKLSDEWKKEYNEALKQLEKEGLGKEEAEELAKDASFHRFMYPEKYTWNELRKNISELPVRLKRKHIKVKA